MIWTLIHPRVQPDDLGLLTGMLSEVDERPAREQLHENYQHGGGWRPMEGFKLDRRHLLLTYPEDPPYRPLACCQLRNELIVVYPYSWVAIIQPDHSFEVCRMD